MTEQIEFAFFDPNSKPMQSALVKRVIKMEVNEVSTHYHKWITLGGVKRYERFRRPVPLINIDVEIELFSCLHKYDFVMDQYRQTYFVLTTNQLENTSVIRSMSNWMTSYKLPLSVFVAGSMNPEKEIR